MTYAPSDSVFILCLYGMRSQTFVSMLSLTVYTLSFSLSMPSVSMLSRTLYSLGLWYLGVAPSVLDPEAEKDKRVCARLNDPESPLDTGSKTFTTFPFLVTAGNIRCNLHHGSRWVWQATNNVTALPCQGKNLKKQTIFRTLTHCMYTGWFLPALYLDTAGTTDYNI